MPLSLGFFIRYYIALFRYYLVSLSRQWPVLLALAVIVSGMVFIVYDSLKSPGVVAVTTTTSLKATTTTLGLNVLTEGRKACLSDRVFFERLYSSFDRGETEFCSGYEADKLSRRGCDGGIMVDECWLQTAGYFLNESYCEKILDELHKKGCYRTIHKSRKRLEKLKLDEEDFDPMFVVPVG